MAIRRRYSLICGESCSEMAKSHNHYWKVVGVELLKMLFLIANLLTETEYSKSQNMNILGVRRIKATM